MHSHHFLRFFSFLCRSDNTCGGLIYLLTLVYQNDVFFNVQDKKMNRVAAEAFVFPFVLILGSICHISVNYAVMGEE